MNPIASYIRHLLVTAIVMLLAKLKFPLEGADAFADAVALLVIATLTWAIVKYVPDLARAVGLLAVALACLIALPSCQASLGPDGRPVIGVDPVAVASAIQQFQKRSGSKAATVLILDSSGKPIPALPPPPPSNP